MSQQPLDFKESTTTTAFAKKDWVLLPLLCLLTIGSLVTATEWLSQRVYPQSRTDIYTCLAGNRQADDVLNGLHGIPDAACQGNNRDTPVTSYHLNAQGHREDAPIAPKSPGLFRIVIVGSSVALGEGVPQNNTFAKLLPQQLSEKLGRPVELYNAASFGEVPDVIAQHFEEALPLQPDLILWVLSAHDLKDTVAPKDTGTAAHHAAQSTLTAVKPANPTITRPGFAARIWRSVQLTFARKSAAQAVFDLWQHGVDHIYGTSSAVVFFQHLLYQNETQYLRSYLASGDAASLRKPLSPDWRDHLQQFRTDDAEIEAQAQKAHIPVIAVLIPNAAQAIMISTGSWQNGFDPYLLDSDLASIVVSHGAAYAHILPLFKHVSNPGQYFFLVNGHPNAAGHALLAAMLSQALTTEPNRIRSSAEPPKRPAE